MVSQENCGEGKYEIPLKDRLRAVETSYEALDRYLFHLPVKGNYLTGFFPAALNALHLFHPTISPQAAKNRFKGIISRVHYGQGQIQSELTDLGVSLKSIMQGIESRAATRAKLRQNLYDFIETPQLRGELARLNAERQLILVDMLGGLREAEDIYFLEAQGELSQFAKRYHNHASRLSHNISTFATAHKRVNDMTTELGVEIIKNIFGLPLAYLI